MKTISSFLSCLCLVCLTSCGPQSDTLPRDMAEARIAQPSDLMESPKSFIVEYRVVEVVSTDVMIVQALGVTYEDEHYVRFSLCHAQGKTPVNVGDTVKVLAEWNGISGKDGYHRTFPPCQE